MKKTILILAAFAMTALSCSKQEGGITPPINGQEDVTYLEINSVTAVEPTKAAIKDTKFPTEKEISIGLFLVGDGYTDAKYSNIEYTKPAGSDAWTDPQIELIEGKTAIVYAYYPYDADVTDIAQIQAASSINGNDWMWATPTTDVSAEKPAIDLSLNHALALVEITFNIYGPEATMTNVTVAGAEGAFSKAGTLDATQGTITPDTQQPASKTSPLSQDVELTLSDSKIVADCLLVPGKTGDDADARQDFYIKCTYNGKTLGASLTGDNGVIIRQGSKSTVSLNIKDNKLEVVSVGVEEWADSNVSGSIATIGDYTVTFNCPEGLKYDLYTESGSTAIPGETTEAEKLTVFFRYDVTSLPDYRFVFNGDVSGCTFTHDELGGIISVKDITDDVTVNLGFGTYIPYTATAKVEPYDKTAFGFPYDEARSTFSGGSGVIAIDGEVKTIGYRAIYETAAGTKVLTGVTVPEGVTEIGQDAFQHCENLTTVTLPEGLKKIGRSAFDYCYNLTIPQFPASLELIDQKAFREAGNSLSNKFNLSLSGKLTTINESTFWNCDNLKEIDMSALTSLEEIGISPFEGCDNLTGITLPSSLKKIGERAFHNCTSLPGIDLAGLVNLSEIGKQAFDGCSSLSSVDLGDCTSLKTISKQGFNNCNILTSVVLPPNLEVIEDNAFWGMGKDAKGELLPFVDEQGTTLAEKYWYSGAKKLEFPNTLKSIGSYAFENATIREMTLPVSLKTVGESAFKGSCVHWVTIQAEEKDGVETGAAIGSNMLMNCATLYRVYVNYKTPPELDNNFLAGSNLPQYTWIITPQKDGVYVPDESREKYLQADIWKGYMYQTY